MKTNNEKGRNIVLIAAVYLIVKEIINTFIGGGLNIGTLLMQVLIAAALISGLKFVNIGAAVILIAVAVSYLPGNLANIGSNFIYLLEGVIDIACGVLICVIPDVKEHFTWPWGEIKDLIEKK